MELDTGDKIGVLLDRLNFHTTEMHRREEKEMRLFEWGTTLLLASFGAVLALSDRSSPLPYPVVIKALATLLVLVPTAIFCIRILSERKSMIQQANLVVKLEDALHLFKEGFYISMQSLYPDYWRVKLPDAARNRRTPLYFVIILLFLLACVTATIWILL